ncbi:hypothetical protein [Thioclava sp. FTW29]|uniref:Etoposide-induced protein 2.4 (EI24) n=1 Tax=Thioclava litoralis TaxID=3076557 RepID=A0ABZ1E5N7_9RHOB|nr:hypothetical protein RPE78_15235 [Thioclava sp. FTW29]
MVLRIFGASLRALLLAFVICVPALLLPGAGADTMQVVAFVALFLAGLTVFEYSSVYPCLVEFRDAAPYNRIRFLVFFGLVILLSLASIAPAVPSTFNRLLLALGHAFGGLLDFPYSPLRLLMQVLPAAAQSRLGVLQSLAGLASMVCLTGIGAFLVAIHALGWPNRQERFNVWVNLPTFDPTMGGDVVDRLRRDSWVNASVGVVLPFLLPVLLKLVSIVFVSVMPRSPHALIWLVILWAFLPTALVMRGMAMGRIAAMIAQRRRHARAEAEAGDDGTYQAA